MMLFLVYTNIVRQSHAAGRQPVRLGPTPFRGERDLLRGRPAAAGVLARFSLGAAPGSGGGLAPFLCVCVWAPGPV